ncbi:MAG: glycosyltransferase family 87 protein [Dehalococcoidia bacterium]
MTEAVAESRPQAAGPSPWTLVSWLFIVVTVGYILIAGVRLTNDTQETMRLLPYLDYDERVDFAYFYAGASLAYHGDAAELYPVPGEITYYPYDPIFDVTQDPYALDRLIARGNYYNPPALAYLHSPLAAMNFKNAFWTFSAFSVAALAGFIGLTWWSGRGIPELPLLILGILTFRPVHEALIMGHSALFFCLALTAGFLLLRARHEVLAGLCFSLLALKPQWAVLPGLFLLVRGEWKTLGTMFVASCVIFFVPFLIVGLETFKNYVTFLRWQNGLDLKDAPHMFSWNGFLFKLRGGPLYGHEPPPAVWTYALVAATALPLAIVWWSRNYLLGVAATVLAMLLISTHSVWYDWALLVIAALFIVLYSRGRSRLIRVEMWVVLLALHISAAQSIHVLLRPDRFAIDWHSSGFFSVTPVAFAALVWLALLALYDNESTFKFPSFINRLRKPQPVATPT